jgi:hypothetical protein
MEAEQVSNRLSKDGYTCKTDEEVQTGARVVVPHFAYWKHCSFIVNVFHMEEGCAASLVGYAVCFRSCFHCHSSHWCHSSNHQSGIFDNEKLYYKNIVYWFEYICQNVHSLIVLFMLFCCCSNQDMTSLHNS